MLAFGVLAGFLFLNTLYLQDGRGYSALHAGAAMTLALGGDDPACSHRSRAAWWAAAGRACRWFSRGADDGGGRRADAAALSDGTAPTGFLLADYALFGLAFGLVNAPISNTAVSGMPNSQAGVAASVASASRQTGSRARGGHRPGRMIASASSAGPRRPPVTPRGRCSPRAGWRWPWSWLSPPPPWRALATADHPWDPRRGSSRERHPRARTGTGTGTAAGGGTDGGGGGTDGGGRHGTGTLAWRGRHGPVARRWKAGDDPAGDERAGGQQAGSEHVVTDPAANEHEITEAGGKLRRS